MIYDAFQTVDLEREEGKMTSQERFWQARLMSKESEHRGELSAIHQQLEALKATTEDAKADLAAMKADDALPKQTVFEIYKEINK